MNAPPITIEQALEIIGATPYAQRELAALGFLIVPVAERVALVHALQSCLVAVTIANALPNVAAEYDFGPTAKEIAAALDIAGVLVGKEPPPC